MPDPYAEAIRWVDVEGLTQIEAARRAGISLPGMPTGSPGMSGPKTEPFTIYSFGGEEEPQVYAVE